MLVISDEQMRVFEIVNPPQFIPEMIQHIASAYPVYTKMLGKKVMTTVIETGIVKAKKYKFTTKYEVGVFIEHMILLGSDFDSDPQLKWSKQILIKEDVGSEEKIDTLFAKSKAYLNKINDPNEKVPIKIFKTLIETSYDNLFSFFKKTASKDYHQFLKNLWPEKYNLIKSDGLDDILETYEEYALEHGFENRETAGFFLIYMFLFGHQFDKDNQFPWIRDLLVDPKYDEDLYKASSLFFTVQKILEQFLAFYELEYQSK